MKQSGNYFILFTIIAYFLFLFKCLYDFHNKRLSFPRKAFSRYASGASVA